MTDFDDFPADTTGSDAEYYAALENDVRLKALHGNRSKGPTAEIAGIYEAVTHVTFENPLGGPPVYMRGPAGARGQQLGTLVQEDHPWLKARPELFRPLRVPIDAPWPPPVPEDGDDHG